MILTTRDAESWYETPGRPSSSCGRRIRAWLRLVLPRIRRFTAMLDRVIWDGTFHGRFADKPYAIDVFARHNENVQRRVPRDRLLVFQVREGWAPLCTFLGMPIPDGKPFPHLNDAAEFRKHTTRIARVMRIFGYSFLTLVVVLVAWLVSRFVL